MDTLEVLIRCATGQAVSTLDRQGVPAVAEVHRTDQGELFAVIFDPTYDGPGGVTIQMDDRGWWLVVSLRDDRLLSKGATPMCALGTPGVLTMLLHEMWGAPFAVTPEMYALLHTTDDASVEPRPSVPSPLPGDHTWNRTSAPTDEAPTGTLTSPSPERVVDFASRRAKRNAAPLSAG